MLMTKITPKNMSSMIQEIRRKRDEQIRRLYAAYKQDPITGWTLERIAGEYGLTKQRVHQIIEEGKDELKED